LPLQLCLDPYPTVLQRKSSTQTTLLQNEFPTLTHSPCTPCLLPIDQTHVLQNIVAPRRITKILVKEPPAIIRSVWRHSDVVWEDFGSLLCLTNTRRSCTIILQKIGQLI
jgi:hypothetical protein